MWEGRFIQHVLNKVDKGQWTQAYADHVIVQRCPSMRGSNHPSDTKKMIWGGGPDESPAKKKLPQSPGQQLSQSPGKHLSQSPGHRLSQSPGHRLSQSPGQQLSQSPAKSPGKQLSLFSFGVKASPQKTQLQAIDAPGSSQEQDEFLDELEAQLKRETLPAPLFTRDEQLEARADQESGKVVDPAAKGQGWTVSAKHGRPATGRTTGTAAGFKSNAREPGGAILREDKTAQQKLYILKQLDQALGQPATKEAFGNMPGLEKAQFAARFDVTYRFIQNLIPRRPELQTFVTNQRLGLTGLRPFGSHGPAMGSSSLGARMRTEISQTQQPLKPVFQRCKQWFHRERKYGHEVKIHQLVTRLRLELMSEIGRQQVLQERQSPDFFEKTLLACQDRLASLNHQQTSSKSGGEWLRKFYYPAIGARARKGQKQSHQDDKFDPVLAKLTWASMDFALYLVQSGSFEELGQLVQDPEAFQANATQTAVVGLDQTPIYTRLRGETKTMVTDEEVQDRSVRRKLTRKTKSSDAQEAQMSAAQLIEHLEARQNQKLQTFQMVSQGGDKYRLTLITIQAIVHWFDPDKFPRGEMPRYILLVPSKTHARLENIDDQGRWIQSVQQNTNFRGLDRIEKHGKVSLDRYIYYIYQHIYILIYICIY